MELRQLRQFVVVAETLNFHRAAERLHMAQPPLSAAIRKLEDELGLVFFNREPRALSLTAGGAIVLEHARRTLREADEVRRSATECATGEQGRLTLGFAATASSSVLPHILPAFQLRFPRVELVLHESTTRELVRELDSHAVDIALLRTPVFEQCHATLTPLQADRFVLAVPASHPLARRDGVALAELGDQPFILYSREKVPAMHAICTLAFRQAGISPKVVQEIVQVPTALGLVESGLGLALVPSATARYVFTSVKLLPITDLPEALAIGIALAHHPESASGPTQRFVELARSLMAVAPPP
jgi:DNA-binding transcriptional LysR family regulator